MHRHIIVLATMALAIAMLVGCSNQTRPSSDNAATNTAADTSLDMTMTCDKTNDLVNTPAVIVTALNNTDVPDKVITLSADEADSTRLTAKVQNLPYGDYVLTPIVPVHADGSINVLNGYGQTATISEASPIALIEFDTTHTAPDTLTSAAYDDVAFNIETAASIDATYNLQSAGAVRQLGSNQPATEIDYGTVTPSTDENDQSTETSSTEAPVAEENTTSDDYVD